MRLLHGTKHPYQPSDTVVSGGFVAPCMEADDLEPTLGCGCGCDGRWMVWATTDEVEARHAALNRPCMCGNLDADHQPRVFEVIISDPEPDPNGWGNASVMGTTGRIVREMSLGESRASTSRHCGC